MPPKAGRPASGKWETVKAKLPTSESKQDGKKRRILWNKFNDSLMWDVHGKEYRSRQRAKELPLEALQSGIEKVLGCSELMQAGPAIQRAYDYARERNPEGSDDKLEFCEFRLLLVYLAGFFDIYRVFDEIDENNDGELSLEELVAAQPTLVAMGLDVPDAAGLWENIRGDDEFVDFDEFAHWCAEQGLAGVELSELLEQEDEEDYGDSNVDREYTGSKIFSECQVKKLANKSIFSDYPPKDALLELLQSAEVDLTVAMRMLQRRTHTVDANMKDKVFGWPPILFAANRGNVPLIRGFIDMKANTEATCNKGNGLLHFTVRGGFTRAVQYLLAQHVPVNNANDVGWTPLFWAAAHGLDELAKTLIAANADIHVTDLEGRTVSMWAARHGHVSIVKELLAVGFDLGLRDNDDLTVMDHARENLVLRTLLLEQEKINQALLSAVQRNSPEEAASALRHGAYVEVSDSMGWRPLTWAMMHQSVELVRLLAKYNADPSFIYASSDVIATLDLEQHQELEAELQHASQTSERMLLAARRGDWQAVEDEVVAGARINMAEEKTKLSCLMFAATQCAPEAVVMLATQRANLEQRDLIGWTPLHFAVQARSAETLSALFHVRADLSITTWEGVTGLHMAAKSDDGGLIQVLVEARCDVDAANSEGYVPLQLAAQWGSVVAMHTLLTCGADASIQDFQGRSVLSLAILSGHLAVVQAMLSNSPPPPEICEQDLLVNPKQVEHDRLKALEAEEAARAAEELKAAEEAAKAAERAERRAQLGSDESDEAETESVESDAKTLEAAVPEVGDDGENEEEKEEEEEEVIEDTYDDRLALLRLTEIQRAQRAEEAVASPHLAVTPSILRWEDADGVAPVAIAAGCRQGAACLPTLIAKKANVDATDAQQSTALMVAAAEGFLSAVEDLLVGGAGPKLKNSEGKTAVDVAKTETIRRMIQRAAVEKSVRKSAPKKREPAQATAGFRLRFEGLPLLLLPEVLEEDIRALMRRCQLVPRNIVVEQDVFMARPLGYAHVDFGKAEEAGILADRKTCTLSGRRVHIIREEFESEE